MRVVSHPLLGVAHFLQGSQVNRRLSQHSNVHVLVFEIDVIDRLTTFALAVAVVAALRVNGHSGLLDAGAIP